MGNVGVLSPIEQLVHLVLDRTVAHLYFYITYYYNLSDHTHISAIFITMQSNAIV